MCRSPRVNKGVYALTNVRASAFFIYFWCKMCKLSTFGAKPHNNIKKDIADLISHLVIRTKNLRSQFVSYSDFLLQRSIEYVANPKNLEKVIISQPKLFEKEFELQWNIILKTLKLESELAKLSKKELDQINLKKKEFIKDCFNKISVDFKEEFLQYSNELNNGISDIKDKLPELIKDAHNKKLGENVVLDIKSEKYVHFNWFIFQTSKILILGDSGCIFEVMGNRRFKSIDDNNDEIINIFLPISKNQLLIGTKFRYLPVFDIKTINKALSSCSVDVYISSENSPEISKLTKIIGQWANLISENELGNYVKQMFLDFERKDSLSNQNDE
jgi:hypothetical protein